jgi:hypothetical protein
MMADSGDVRGVIGLMHQASLGLIDLAQVQDISRARLREVVTSYWKDTDPTAIRKAIAGEDNWSTQTYRTPSNRIEFVQLPKTDGDLVDAGRRLDCRISLIFLGRFVCLAPCNCRKRSRI